MTKDDVLFGYRQALFAAGSVGRAWSQRTLVLFAPPHLGETGLSRSRDTAQAWSRRGNASIPKYWRP